VVFENRDILIRYLLGDLPEEELERLAEEYFVHDDAWQALSAVENDLIDDYVRGRLSQAVRQKFERHFMRFPERQERVEFARILMNPAIREQITGDATPHLASEEFRDRPTSTRHWSRSRAAGFIWAAVALSLLSIIGALTIQNRRLSNEVKIQHAQAERLAREQQETANRKTQADAGSPLHTTPIISLVLSPGVLRNNGSNAPMLHLGADPSVELVLDLDQDSYAEYAAIIKTADGKLISHIRGLISQPTQSGGRVVSLNVPSQLLRKNDYVVTLLGRQTSSQAKVVDSYVFSVLRP
jgi:heme exporter protein D